MNTLPLPHRLWLHLQLHFQPRPASPQRQRLQVETVTQVTLSPGAVESLLPTGASRLTVLQGRVWLTNTGDADDHFLLAGQAISWPAAGRVVVENDGMLPAVLQLAPR